MGDPTAAQLEPGRLKIEGDAAMEEPQVPDLPSQVTSPASWLQQVAFFQNSFVPRQNSSMRSADCSSLSLLDAGVANSGMVRVGLALVLLWTSGADCGTNALAHGSSSSSSSSRSGRVAKRIACVRCAVLGACDPSLPATVTVALSTSKPGPAGGRGLARACE